MVLLGILRAILNFLVMDAIIIAVVAGGYWLFKKGKEIYLKRGQQDGK